MDEVVLCVLTVCYGMDEVECEELGSLIDLSA